MTQPEHDGPLSASVAGGGAVLEQPKRPFNRFRATFGAFTLCTQTAEAVPVLRGIRYPVEAPTGIRTWIRTITPQAAAAARPAERPNFAPLAFGLGAPPTFDQTYAASIEMPGRYDEGVTGVSVKQTCNESSAANAALNRGGVPGTQLQELMVDIPAGTSGVQVDGFVIDYTVGNDSFELSIDWDMIICGRTSDREECP